jgi:fructoselysine-6-P-deglycase FrlB-like protein
MGKAYSSELDQVEATLDWCSSQSVDVLRSGTNLPLICVGAGGSFSAAVFAAACAERQFGTVATPVTPLEYAQRSRYLAQHATLLISAEGKSADILHAAAAAAATANEVSALTFSPAAPLVRLLHERVPGAEVLALTAPWGKDGYLATNSLVATVALLAKRFGYIVQSASPCTGQRRVVGHPGPLLSHHPSGTSPQDLPDVRIRWRLLRAAGRRGPALLQG